MAESLPHVQRCYSTLEQWESAREEIKRNLFASMGGLDYERTPLNPRIVGKVERDDYVIEKSALESRPNFLVTSNLYPPRNAEFPAPAVIYVHGHAHEPDIPQIAALIAPRSLYLVNPVNGENEPLPEEELKIVFSRTSDVYELLKAEYELIVCYHISFDKSHADLVFALKS